jgi:hypothetical protein
MGLQARFKRGLKPGGVRSPFLTPGKFKVKCESMRFVKGTRAGTDLFALEMTILESDDPNTKPGSRRQYSVTDNEDNQGFILTIAMAFMGIDPTVVPTDEELADIGTALETFAAPEEKDATGKVIKGQAARGLVCMVNAYHLMKKGEIVKTKKGDPVTVGSFYPCDEAAAA